mgnify:FL=1
MKEIDGLYAYGVYIEPMLLADGSWRWVVSDFAFEPEIYDSEGIEQDVSLFALRGESSDDLLKPFQPK